MDKKTIVLLKFTHKYPEEVRKKKVAALFDKA